MMKDISMATYITAADVMRRHPLFVFALASEAAEVFDRQDKLVVGVGKLNAAYHLTRALASRRPGLIVNLGSAGSPRFSRGSILCCTRFVQRDMDVRPLGFSRFETPFSDTGPVLSYGLALEGLAGGTCGSGDTFETMHACADYDVIDMEAYALAFVARRQEIPFLCLKYISDGADGTAAEEWTVQVHRTALAFKTLLGI